MITKTDKPSPPAYEETRKESLNGLQRQVSIYEVAQGSGNEQGIEQEVPRVASAMQNVGDSHTDPKVKAVWYKKAKKFLRANRATRRGILREVRDVVVGLVSIPFAVVGFALCVTGNIVQGVGSAIVGIGEFLAGEDHPRRNDDGPQLQHRDDSPTDLSSAHR